MNGMNNSRNFAWLPVLLLGAFVAGCGGDDNGRDPVLGFDGGFVALAPAVTAVAQWSDRCRDQQYRDHRGLQ